MNAKHSSSIIRIAVMAFVVVASLLALNWKFSAGAPNPAKPTPTDIMMSTDIRLTPPPKVYPPTQADQGAQVYFQVCMICHGDKGQGLTEEWRNVLGAPDNDCWHSKCHAANHPPGGFVFPKVVPAVVGPNILASFGNAKGLHDFLQQKMPWQAPGYLKPDEYWQLTAYMMRLNGADPGKQTLDATSAAAIHFGQATPTPPVPYTSVGFYLAAIGVVAAALVILFFLWRRGK